jgi:hydroxyacylglutathione hydrolase
MHTVTTLGTLADNYTYVIERDGDAVAIDPGEASPVLRVLESSGSRLLAVLCTHNHFDHTGGNDELARRTGCPVLLPDATAADDGSELTIGPFRFTVLRTPGHSADSVCLYLPPENGRPGDVFTGDTLFVGGCGRLLTRSPEMMRTSLQLLAALPPETRVFCGHDYTLENYEFAVTVEPDNRLVQGRLDEMRKLAESCMPTVPSTIAVERNTNPFLRAAQPAMKRAVGMENATDVEVFAQLRRMKDRF